MIKPEKKEMFENRLKELEQNSLLIE